MSGLCGRHSHETHAQSATGTHVPVPLEEIVPSAAKGNLTALLYTTTPGAGHVPCIIYHTLEGI